MASYQKAPNKADITRNRSKSVIFEKREKRAQRGLKDLEKFNPAVEKAIKEAEKRGLKGVVTKRLNLIREMETEDDSCFFSLWKKKKIYTETEEELLNREQELLQHLRNDGYKVKLDGGYVIIEW